MNKPKIIWLNTILFASTALITIIGVPLYAVLFGFDLWQISAMIISIGFCEISITAGYHRLWSHRAYQAHWTVRLILAIGGTFATQNSILHWASDHRMHHKYVDNNEKDPYSAKRGFWYSHIGWMVRYYQIGFDPAYKNCSDLKKDPIVVWQHRYYLPLVILINFGIPIVLGLLHGDLFGMLLLAGVARLFIAHHFTFFINSLAHIWGKQPYTQNNSARDNGFLAFLTMGEGYHNYHHCFQRDYRNGIHWYQFDPTKWLIKGLNLLGLTRGLYQIPISRIEYLKAKNQLQNTLEYLERKSDSELLIERLQREYKLLLNKIDAFSQAKQEWMNAKTSRKHTSGELCHLKRKALELKHKFSHQKRNWISLNAHLQL